MHHNQYFTQNCENETEKILLERIKMTTKKLTTILVMKTMIVMLAIMKTTKTMKMTMMMMMTTMMMTIMMTITIMMKTTFSKTIFHQHDNI